MARPEPTLQNILDQKSLKWVFVGGKGGVGKTTTSSSLAIQLAAVRESVLLISTDPAHNLSDAFNQQFSKVPTLINGFTNLYAMEVDPRFEIPDDVGEGEAGAPLGEIKNLIRDVGGSMPGMDEAMGMMEVMNLVSSSQFSVVVFDTPPTGHMLRFLQLPSLFERTYGRLSGLRGMLGPMMSQIGSMLGMPQGGPDLTQLDGVQERMRSIKREFSNPQLTTFVGVCIAEFLSLYETERLVQELARLEIDVRNIVVNQLVIPQPGSTCEYCLARQRMQRKYLEQMVDLYEDFHLVMLPMRTKEVRGKDDLSDFSRMLLSPPEGVKALQKELAGDL